MWKLENSRVKRSNKGLLQRKRRSVNRWKIR